MLHVDSNLQWELVARLNPVHAAAFDSYENSRRPSCFNRTRARLLEEIQHWVNDDNRQSVYVLSGVAGIGKSTVAKTVAEQAAAERKLGASFFFSKDEVGRKTAKSFFPTLAHQLSRYSMDFATSLSEVLRKDPGVATGDLPTQFDRLLAEPLGTRLGAQTPILLVIDALDECDEDDVKSLLHLIGQETPKIQRLKVFITARPERHIRLILHQYSQAEQFHMHDIEDKVVEADIQSYLESRLSPEEVQAALPELPPPPWQPTREQIHRLVAVSGNLFILASTAVSFILDPRRTSPARQLATLLDGVSAEDYSGVKHNTIMDNVYMQIIRSAQPDPVGAWTEQFQLCVGTIMLLYDPLPSASLAEFIGVDEMELIGTLLNLHSLFAPRGDEQLFQVHHKSFPDFISDPDRCKIGPQFYIDLKAHHLRIAKRCLLIMSNSLGPSLWDPEPAGQSGVRHHMRNRISQHLAYACMHWAVHLVNGLDGTDDEAKQLLQNFARSHLLSWLQVLSVIGRLDVAYRSLDMVRKIPHFNDPPDPNRAVSRFWRRSFTTHNATRNVTPELLSDGCILIQKHYSILLHSPMTIHRSILPFVPRGTALANACLSHNNAHHSRIDTPLRQSWRKITALSTMMIFILCMTLCWLL